MATLVQVILESRTGFPKDRCINTFHFATDEFDGTEVADCTASIDSFYNELATGQTSDIASRISEVIDRTVPVRVRFFNTLVAGVGPYAETSFTLDASTGDAPLPSEAAVCLSYRQNGAVGLQGRRQRGRIFIGPLNTGTIDVSAQGQAIVDAGFTNDLLEAGRSLWASADIASWGPWVVHSTYGSTIIIVGGKPRMVNPPDVQTDYPIDHLFVDDAFDTQRRRGEAPLTRRQTNLP